MTESIDAEALRASSRDVLVAGCPAERVVKHAVGPGGVMRPLWDRLVGLGWTTLSIPMEDGGLGLGIDALAVVYEELGRVAAPLPFLSTALAIEAIAGSGTEAQRAGWLARIAAGAIAAMQCPAPLETTMLRLEHGCGTVTLSGGAEHILDAADAGLILLVARDAAGALHRVILDPVHDPVHVERRTIWDRGHSLSSIRLDGLSLPADRNMPATAGSEEALATHAAIGLAAAAVGGSDALLALTIEYLKTRQQFGKPIGSFQALKHRIADHRTRLEGDRLLLRSAVSLAAAGDAGAGAEASAAKALACLNYVELARDAIQLHGGIGFTAEHASHVFAKRAWLNEALFGDRKVHIARAAAFLADRSAA